MILIICLLKKGILKFFAAPNEYYLSQILNYLQRIFDAAYRVLGLAGLLNQKKMKKYRLKVDRISCLWYLIR